MKDPFQVKAEEQFINACVNGNVELLKDAVSKGVNIHYENDYVLRIGSYRNHIENVKYALSIASFGKTTMEIAIRSAEGERCFELMQLLINKIRKEKLEKLCSTVKKD
jgi:hypothetical protein